MTPKELIQSIEKGKVLPLYYLYGDELFKIEEAFERIRTLVLKPGTEAFNTDLFFAGELNPDTLMSSAHTLPVLATHRFIVVKEAHRLSAKNLEKLWRLVEDPVESTCLVFMAEQADLRKKFFKRLAQVGAVVKFDRVYENEMPNWVKYLAKKQKKRITPEAIQYLIETVGTDLTSVSNELGKASLFVGEREQIETQDLEQVVSRLKLNTVFELNDFLGMGKTREALMMMESLLSGGEEPLFLLAMIARHYRNIWMCLGLREEGAQQSAISQILRIHPRFAARFFKQVNRFRIEDFGWYFERLVDSDRELKSGSVHPRAVVTRLMLDLVQSPPQESKGLWMLNSSMA